MKALFVYSLSVLFVCAVVAFPANNPSDDVETIDVPPEHRDKPDVQAGQTPDFGDFDGVIISDVNPGFFAYTPVFPYSFNFDFVTRLQDMLKSFRQQAWPFDSSIDGDTDTKWITNIPDDGKRNMTSKVEIIDGHKVITNDTIIAHKTEFGDAVISIRVVDIEPFNGNESTETTSMVTKAPEKSASESSEKNYSPEELDPSTKHNEVSNDIEWSKMKMPDTGVHSS